MNYTVITYNKQGKVERTSQPMYYADALALFEKKSRPGARKRYAIRKVA